MWRVTADNGLPRCEGYRWGWFGPLGSSFGAVAVVDGDARTLGHFNEAAYRSRWSLPRSVEVSTNDSDGSPDRARVPAPQTCGAMSAFLPVVIWE
jgi:hypothetical protein